MALSASRPCGCTQGEHLMTDTARAAVLTAQRTLTMRDLPIPEIGDDDGLLRVEACGICGSDVHAYTAERAAGYSNPVIPGHEPIGTIVALGDNAARRWGVRVGDRVGVEAAIMCGRCEICRSGRNMGCTDPRLPGPMRSYSTIPVSVSPHLWGGYAEFLYLDREATLHKVPDGVSLEEAALLNAAAAAVEWAVRVPQPQMGDNVVVLGPGQRGLLCVAALREVGVGNIVVTGLRSDAHKLELAREFGATRTVCVEDEDLKTAVLETTGGQLADVVIDVTADATQPVLDAIEVVRHGGKIVLAGVKNGRAIDGFVSDALFYKDITMRGVLAASSESFRRAMWLIASHHHPLHLMHTHSFALDRAGEAILTLAGETEGAPAIAVTINP
jgi:threonine dehydrogenase-like Zn-dependent dehydrogenase